MRPTGETAFEYEKIKATKDGFRVTFTRKVEKAQLADLDTWTIKAWTYKHTHNYGGPKVGEHQVKPIQAVAGEIGRAHV